MLSPWDHVGVWAFDSLGYEVVPMQLCKNPNLIKAKISKINEGGGTDMHPGMTMARDALIPLKQAAIKHMLVLTDGQSAGTGYPDLVRDMRKQGITVSTVAVGDGADVQLLQEMARVGGGRFHFAKSAKTLPRIFQQEARKISRPLIYENPAGFGVIRKYPHEMLKGIDGSPPALTGYIRTTVKTNPLVEVALVAAEPRDAGAESERYNTLLASWTYGLGKSVVWTSDAGQRWANRWSNQWGDYDRFFSQMVRWAMRPSGDTGKFQVVTETKDGRGRLIVTALDQEDRFLNFLNFGGSVVGPGYKPLPITVKQVAPGRYVAEFDAAESGNYHVNLAPGGGLAPILTGLNVPYSAEYLDREPNEGLLRDLASLEPAGGRGVRSSSATICRRCWRTTRSVTI
ncbi:MAG: VWA domain-containing protein [Pirellulales bacterium]